MTSHELELVAELRGLKCRCGAVKVPRQTFCRRCYYALPPALRKALYNGISEGYAAAYAAAATHLEQRGITRAL